MPLNSQFSHTTSNTHKMPSTARIDEALAVLKTQELPDIANTAKKYDLWPSMLQRHFYNLISSRQEATDRHHSALLELRRML